MSCKAKRGLRKSGSRRVDTIQTGGRVCPGKRPLAIYNSPSGERDTMEPKGTIDWTNLQIWGKRRKKQKKEKKKSVLCVAHCRRVWSRAGSRLSLREGDETPPSKSKYYIETNCMVFLHGENSGRGWASLGASRLAGWLERAARGARASGPRFLFGGGGGRCGCFLLFVVAVVVYRQTEVVGAS